MKTEKTKSRPARKKQDAKTERTRKKILAAAQKIFCANPYRTATTRAIAREANVDHPLIHYHFGSKQELFVEMALKMLHEFIGALGGWFEGMEKMGLQQGMEVFIERMIESTVAKPEAMQLILINMAQERASEEIPGFDYLQLFTEQSRQLLSGLFPNLPASEDTDKFIISFANLVISFIGGKETQARVIGLDPDGDQYKEWVKEALLAIFLPWLQKLKSSSAAAESKK